MSDFIHVMTTCDIRSNGHALHAFNHVLLRYLQGEPNHEFGKLLTNYIGANRI